MTREDIVRMARECQFAHYYESGDLVAMPQLERFAALVAAAEREKLAAWMMRQGYATGHGDTIEDLLKELEWQIAEREREACAKAVEDYCGAWDDEGYALATAIRSKGEK